MRMLDITTDSDASKEEPSAGSRNGTQPESRSHSLTGTTGDPASPSDLGTDIKGKYKGLKEHKLKPNPRQISESDYNND